MDRVRLGALAGVMTVAGALLVAVAQPAGAAAPPPAYTGVIGRSSHYVVFNDYSNRTVYLADPTGEQAPKLFARDASATAVSGNLVEYTVGHSHKWSKLGTSRHGSVPSGWTALAPDGGLRVSRSGAQATLRYRHLNGTTTTTALPAALAFSGARYSIVAGTAGIVVAASAAKHAPSVAFARASAPTTFRLLNSTGVPHMALTCMSMASPAVGCLAGSSVVRLAVDGVAAPQVLRSGPAPFHVAVTNAGTSWTAPRSASKARACPCTVTSIDTTGTALSIVAGVTSRSITAGSERFFYTAYRKPSTAGVYATKMAGTGDRKIARAASHRAG